MAYGGRKRVAKRVTRRTGRRIGGYRRNYRASLAYKAKRVIARRLNRKEIKYDDDYYTLKTWAPSQWGTSGFDANWINYTLGGLVVNRKKAGSSNIIERSGGTREAWLMEEVFAPNCLTNIGSGNTANTRVGNLIQPRFITIRGVLEASKTNVVSDAETTINQEALGESAAAQARYIRTSVRVYIVRDKHMNEKGYVRYDDVFEPPDSSATSSPAAAGLNPFLWNRKIDVINRYDIIKVLSFELDGDDPQKAFTTIVPLKGKAIRFNGAAQTGVVITGTKSPLYDSSGNLYPSGGDPNAFEANIRLQGSSEVQSMTNGIYLLAVSHSCTANGLSASNFTSPSLVFSSRLTFED